MRTCSGIALALAVLLGGPIVVQSADFQVALGDNTGSNYTGPSPFQSSAQRAPGRVPFAFMLEYAAPSESLAYTFAAEAPAPETLLPPLDSLTRLAAGQAPADGSNTTIILAPEAGMGAILGNNGTAINTTIVQQLTFTGKRYLKPSAGH